MCQYSIINPAKIIDFCLSNNVARRNIKITTSKTVVFLLIPDYRKRIKMHHKILVDIIQPQYGLVQTLHSLDVLSNDERDKVKRRRTVTKMNKKLLNLMLEKTCEDDFDNFASALTQTGQRHVVNYIHADGGDAIFSIDSEASVN